MVKKILLVSYYFNQRDIIAPVRLRGLVKYLPGYGWEATVLTVKCNPSNETNNLENKKVIATDYNNPLSRWKTCLGLNPNDGLKEQLGSPTYKKKKSFIDIGLHIFSEIIMYPEPEIEWYKSAIEAGTNLLKNESFDIILSSSGPCTSHIIASYLSKQFNIPWIADFRDLWTQNHYYPYSIFRKIIETRLEKKTMEMADALISVSQPLSEELSKRYPNKYVSSIANGFDPEKTNPGIPLCNKFTITYTGQLYRGRRDPELLFRALSELIKDGKLRGEDVSVNFYGSRETWLNEDIDKYNLGEIVSLHGSVSQEIAIKKQWESHILLLLTWDNPLEKGVYTGKVFEYLAARRPILSLGLSGGVVTKLLEDTNAGVHISTKDEIKSYIIMEYNEFKMGGYTHYTGIESEIEKYNHYEMAKKFSGVLDEVIFNRTNINMG